MKSLKPNVPASALRSPAKRSQSKKVDDFVNPLAAYLTKYVVKETFSGGFDWDFYAFQRGKELTSDEFQAFLGVDPTFLTGD